jgi:hypothetical protein
MALVRERTIQLLIGNPQKYFHNEPNYSHVNKVRKSDESQQRKKK